MLVWQRVRCCVGAARARRGRRAGGGRRLAAAWARCTPAQAHGDPYQHLRASRWRGEFLLCTNFTFKPKITFWLTISTYGRWDLISNFSSHKLPTISVAKWFMHLGVAPSAEASKKCFGSVKAIRRQSVKQRQKRFCPMLYVSEKIIF